MKNKLIKTNSGITLIALVITIIVLLILAGVTIATLTGDNGILTQATNAKTMTQISSLKEEIDMYVVGEELNNVEGIDRYPIIKEETMESVDKNLLSIELKQKMSKWANTAQNGEIATIDTIDYSKFYKIDKEKVNTANSFEGDLYLIEIDGDYKVISIDGVIYEKENINIIIPLNDVAEPEYITVGSNTYKWYGDGSISVIGELNSNSGITSEESSQINGLQEFDLKEIAKDTGMVFDNNVETEQNIAKVNGVKKIYFNSGTAYIIDANDDLWAWGTNEYNKLGQGNSYLVTEPTKILEGRTEGASDVKAKNVWAGPTNTFVLDTNNRLWACGANTNGVLGQGNNNTYYNFVEVKIDGLNNSDIQEIFLRSINNKQLASAIVKCSNGKVYGCGTSNYGNFGIGTNTSYNQFIELSAYNEIWQKAERIYNEGIITFVFTEDGKVYGAGYNSAGALGVGHTNNINTLTELDNDIIDVRPITDASTFFLKNDGYLYANNSNGNLNRINGLQDVDMQFLSNYIVLSKSKMYKISSSSVSNYYHEYNTNEFLDMKSMNGFISNNKIYLDSYPNITKPGAKSIYTLKNVFTGAQFVQSGGNNINIVDNEGNIYEGINNKNTQVDNIKQLVSSNNAQFALSEDGKLYAKGNGYMWGDVTSQNQYTIVTKDGNEEFNNVEKIFAIKNGLGCIFITNDNEIYWAGATAFMAMPDIKGSVQTVGAGKRTEYPEKIENEIINSIIDKIKDIKFTYINSGGIDGRNTLILTDDGKLYSYSNNSNMTGVGETSDFTEIKFDGATVEQIDTLDGLSLAVLSNGEVYGWGYNTNGILGDGYDLGGIYPTPVKLNLSNVRTMSLGNGFAIFATYAGEVYGIGKNGYGQLGTGDNVGASTFVRCEELEK